MALHELVKMLINVFVTTMKFVSDALYLIDLSLA